MTPTPDPKAREALEPCPEPMCNEAGKCMCPGACLRDATRPPVQSDLVEKLRARIHDHRFGKDNTGTWLVPMRNTEIEALLATLTQATAPVPAGESFQTRVDAWMSVCFGAEIKADIVERCDRFIEEALEFVQAAGYSAERAHALVDYTFGRPQGAINQELGGVMVTLAAMSNALGLNINQWAEAELARIWTKIEQIRAKQAAKPTGSALPVATEAAALPQSVKEALALGLEARDAALRLDANDQIGAFNIGALAFAQAVSALPQADGEAYAKLRALLVEHLVDHPHIERQHRLYELPAALSTRPQSGGGEAAELARRCRDLAETGAGGALTKRALYEAAAFLAALSKQPITEQQKGEA